MLLASAGHIVGDPGVQRTIGTLHKVQKPCLVRCFSHSPSPKTHRHLFHHLPMNYAAPPRHDLRHHPPVSGPNQRHVRAPVVGDDFDVLSHVPADLAPAMGLANISMVAGGLELGSIFGQDIRGDYTGIVLQQAVANNQAAAFRSSALLATSDLPQQPINLTKRTERPVCRERQASVDRLGLRVLGCGGGCIDARRKLSRVGAKAVRRSDSPLPLAYLFPCVPPQESMRPEDMVV